MKRDLKIISEEKFDLLVIGGGIYGANLFWQASLCGLRVALVEKGDFASATSANSLKVIHGGLRYLQKLDIPRIRQSIRERNRLMRLAPHLVQPLKCLMPVYGHGVKGIEAMWAGLNLYDLLSVDKNKGLLETHLIPKGKVFSVDECQKVFPGVQTDELSGGALWYDSLCVNTERLVLEFIKTGCVIGGQAANYVEAQDIVSKKGEEYLLNCTDTITGEAFAIQSKKIAWCVGPWINTVPAKIGLGNKIGTTYFAAGVNLVLDTVPNEYAVAVKSRKKSGRFLFMIPWHDKTILGTEYFFERSSKGECQINRSECETLINEYNASVGYKKINMNNILLVHKGLLPCSLPSGGESYDLDSHFKIVDFSSYNYPGMVSVTGVKYTTAGDVTERVLKHLFPWELKKMKTADQFTLGGKFESFLQLEEEIKGLFKHEIQDDEIKAFIKSYGAETKKVFSLAKTENTSEPLLPKFNFLKGQSLFAIRDEMAVRLSDVMLRRTDLCAAGRPQRFLVEEVSLYMARELDWDNCKREKEIDQFEQEFPLCV